MIKLHLLLPFFSATFLFGMASFCRAERHGIVIGNRDYSDTGRFPDLATTVNDAAVMYQLLAQAGLKMAPGVKDSTRLGMEEALIKFCNGLKPGDEAVVYYAGHGIQFENKVYLMGVNAEFRIKAKLAEEAVSQETLTAMLGERGVKLAVLILDCCREVPDQSWLASEQHTRGLRGDEAPALAPPPNILVGYATSSGRLTNDSLRATDANGPLVMALRKHWNEGLEFDPLWKAVARDVFTASRSVEQGRAELQMPSKYGQTIHDFYFVSSTAGRAVTPSVVIPAAPTAPVAPRPSIPPVPPAGGSALAAGAAGKVGQTTLPGGVIMTFAYCPPGIFTIGSPKTEEGRNSDEAQSMVRLKEGFWMGQTEVTQQQWAALMPDNPSEFKGEDLPVDSVNRVDAQAFIDKLNQNSPPGVGWRYSLPSEAQWEYACRAGTQTVFNFGDELDGSQAYCNGNFPYGTTAKGAVQRGTCAVAGRKPNAWGLYDMHGNVWEWCTDFYNEKGAGSGKRDAAGSNLSVLRGGAWSDIAQLCRSARRLSCFTDYSSNGLGLRVAMVPK